MKDPVSRAHDPVLLPSRMQLLAILTIMLVGAVLASSVRGDSEPLPTPMELHKMFDDGQYQPLLAKLTRVLQLKGDLGKAYDHVDLETLRADTMIELKQTSTATAAIADAVKTITDKTDPKIATLARATQVLYKHSQSLAYTPKTGAPGESKQPISLLDMTQRKAAYTALLQELQTETAAKSKAAKTLPAIILAIRGIADMRVIELQANGSETESQKAADELAVHAKGLMSDAVQLMGKRAKEIDDTANTLVANPTTSYKNAAGRTVTPDPTYHKKGIDSRVTGELKEIVDNCVKVEMAAKDFATISKQNAAGFDETATAAEKTAIAASATMKADYRGTVAKK